jgi:hypothetical protein
VDCLAEQCNYPELTKLLTLEIDAKMERELKKQMEATLQKTPATCDDTLHNQQDIIREINLSLIKAKFIEKDVDTSRDTR